MLMGQKASADVIKIDPAVNEVLVQEAAAATKGFSGRELAKMVASMQVPPLCRKKKIALMIKKGKKGKIKKK